MYLHANICSYNKGIVQHYSNLIFIYYICNMCEITMVKTYDKFPVLR